LIFHFVPEDDLKIFSALASKIFWETRMQIVLYKLCENIGKSLTMSHWLIGVCIKWF